MFELIGGIILLLIFLGLLPYILGIAGIVLFVWLSYKFIKFLFSSGIITGIFSLIFQIISSIFGLFFFIFQKFFEVLVMVFSAIFFGIYYVFMLIYKSLLLVINLIRRHMLALVFLSVPIIQSVLFFNNTIFHFTIIIILINLFVLLNVKVSSTN
jgi:hypothetical protein